MRAIEAFRLGGHVPIEPSGVAVQLKSEMSLEASPPPVRKACAAADLWFRKIETPGQSGTLSFNVNPAHGFPPKYLISGRFRRAACALSPAPARPRLTELVNKKLRPTGQRRLDRA